jgi:hypothetical protein
VRHIPFWKTVFQSIGFVFSQLPALLVIGWGPFIANAAASYILFFDKSGALNLSFVLKEPVQLLSLLALAVFSANWHRFVILGEVARGPNGWFSKRLLPFIGYTVVLIFLPGQLAQAILTWLGEVRLGSSAGFSALNALLLTGLFFGGLLALLRFSMVFPAVAVERKMRLSEAWARMYGNTWRLFWGAVVVVFVFMVPLLPFEFGDFDTFKELAGPKGQGRSIEAGLPFSVLIGPFENFLSSAVIVTMLSRIYLHVMGPPESGPADTGPAPTP